MVKDVIISAMLMLNLTPEAEETAALSPGVTSEISEKFLRLYNLVVSEIHDEYRRTEYPETPVASSIEDAEAKFFGISPRVLAYGIAAEYCIIEGLDEAETWDGRYKSGLSLAARPKIKIKARRMY